MIRDEGKTMAGGSEGRNRIKIEQVCIGLHIKLDSWLGHPFLLSSFKIKDEQQIAALRTMGLTDIEYLPGKSDSGPLPPPADDPGTSATASDEPDESAEVLKELMREKKARIETLNRERERIRTVERKYVKTANGVQNVMRLAGNNPAQAAQLSGEIAGDMAEIFLAEQNPYIPWCISHVRSALAPCFTTRRLTPCQKWDSTFWRRRWFASRATMRWCGIRR